MLTWPLTADERRPGRHADRRRTEGVGEVQPFRHESVKMRCLDQRMAMRPDAVVPVLVGHDQDDVRRRQLVLLSRGQTGSLPERGAADKAG